jgi:hypothetical protein
MAAGTTGSTSSPQIKQVVGCANGVSWTLRQEINPSDLTTHQSLYVNNTTGATQTTAPAGFVPVACEIGKDAEFTVHCDTSTAPPTPYIKRVIVDFSTTPPTQSFVNYSLAGAAFTPGAEGVCDGYDLVEGCAEVVSTTTGVVQPVRTLQLSRYGVLIGTPVLYSVTTNAVITPAGTDRVINCGSLQYSESLLCDSSVPPVPFWRTQSKVGSTVLFTQDLNVGKTAVYAPVGAVGVCQSNTTDDEYACIAGATPNDDTIQIRIVRVYNGGLLLSEVRTRMDTYAVVANNVPLVPCTESAETINAGSSLHTGNAAAIVPAGRRSVTITVRSGAVTASGSQHSGAANVFEAGESYTWSRVSEGELLAAMTFTGTTGATRFKLTWTV